MKKQVNSILIPVDFTENTSVALSKAMDFMKENDKESVIHLLHVHHIKTGGVFSYLKNLFTGYTRQRINSELKESDAQLAELKAMIERAHKDIKVTCSTIFGQSVQDTLVSKASALHPDIIIVGKKSHHSFFPFLNTVHPHRLAMITGIPVLMAKPGSLHNEIKTVVIPIGKTFPGNKLQVLWALKNKLKLRIVLTAFRNDEEETKQLLLYTFRMLKSQFSNPVSYEMLEGDNKAKALLKYCNKVGADLLVVNPGLETRVGSLISSHISDIIPTGSKTQVLAVTPG